MSENGQFKTDEGSLAVYLIMEGFTYNLQRGIRFRDGRDRETAFWVFDKTEELVEARERYKAGSALVEPARFARTWGVVRSEMLNYIRRG